MHFIIGLNSVLESENIVQRLQRAANVPPHYQQWSIKLPVEIPVDIHPMFCDPLCLNPVHRTLTDVVSQFDKLDTYKAASHRN